MRGIGERNRVKREGTSEFCKQTTPSLRVSKKLSSKPSPAERAVVVGATPSSLPMNIPNWSKILKDEYRDNNQYKEKREGPVREKRKEKVKRVEREKRIKNYKNVYHFCPYCLIFETVL